MEGHLCKSTRMLEPLRAEGRGGSLAIMTRHDAQAILATRGSRTGHDRPAETFVSALEALAGLVERVTFHNRENGFSVLWVKARGQRELVTVVAHAPVIAGERGLLPWKRSSVFRRSASQLMQLLGGNDPYGPGPSVETCPNAQTAASGLGGGRRAAILSLR